MYDVNSDYTYLKRFKREKEIPKKVSIFETKAFDLFTSWMLIIDSVALTVAMLLTM